MKKQKFNDFYDAWWWPYYHPLFIDYEAVYRDKRFLDNHDWAGEDICNFYSRMQDYIEVSPHKVNPKTRSIDDDQSLNTHVEIWIETGYRWREKIPFYEKDHWWFYHDINLDCGGDTYEEAIVNLANLVWKHYKDGKKFMDKKLKSLGIKVK